MNLEGVEKAVTQVTAVGIYDEGKFSDQMGKE
jgi:hypothetical protein